MIDKVDELEYPSTMSPDAQTDLTGRLSATLFWDVDRSSVDPVRHQKWLLTRILERGTWSDWLLISSFLGPEEIHHIEPALRISPRERSFLKTWLAQHDVR